MVKKDFLQKNMPALEVTIQQPQNLHRNQPFQLQLWAQYCLSAAGQETKKKVTGIELNSGSFIQKLGRR